MSALLNGLDGLKIGNISTSCFAWGVEFPAADPLPIHPYLLGVLLGDGGLTLGDRIHLTSIDEPVVREVERIVNGYGLHVVRRPHLNRAPTYAIVGRLGKGRVANGKQPLRQALQQLGLLPIRCEERFVPPAFKTASRQDRLELLAGLIDTDGSLRYGTFEFVSKSSQLANDVIYVARSLGLAAYVTPKQVHGVIYHRVFISGKCSMIPTRILRKQAYLRQQKKGTLRTGFTCVSTGTIESFYGFTLDGDQRYLLDDFTVTHNCGKTLIFAALLRRLNEPALILAHREELLTQAREKIHWLWPEADVGLISGNLGLDEPGHQITIASVPSITRPQRLRSLAASGIQTVIVDECHHGAARSYHTILNALRAGCLGGPKLLGVTATPERGDKRAIEPIFGKPVFSLPLDMAIAAGHLAPLTGIAVQTGTNLDGVRTRRGDFVEQELAQAVNTVARNDEIVWAWLTHARGRPTLCFTVNVQHAHDLAATFRSAGVKATALDGTMPREARQCMLQQYHSGELEVVCNCNLLSEGFDAPGTSCIIMARPTQSRPLYVQQVGRGARTAPAKADCLILDVCDVSSKHKLSVQHLPEATGMAYLSTGEEQLEQKAARKPASPLLVNEPTYRPAPVQTKAVELVLNWEHVGEGRYKLALKEGTLWVAPREGGYIVGIVFKDGRKQQLTPRPVSLEWAQAFADDKARLISSKSARLVDQEASWRSKPASQRQLRWLEHWGVAYPEGCTAGEASDLIDQAVQPFRMRMG